MDKEQIQQLITAIGAMAECAGVYFKALQAQGFTAEQALFLTNTMTRALFSQSKQEDT